MMPTKVRSFLGLAGYYRRFIEKFASIAAPLTKLTQKAAKFQWFDACERSFHKTWNLTTKIIVVTSPKESRSIFRVTWRILKVS
ncbi:MAG: hypothetical protein Q8887_02565, partial [Candidatus Phytoplasma australasiaticum]|nr:hypothetical protein [Candidatus Phytoplasma australasiaticum]